MSVTNSFLSIIPLLIDGSDDSAAPSTHPTAQPTFNSCPSFEFHGTSPYSTSVMGTYTYAGEYNGRPWFQHSGGFYTMYKADNGILAIGNSNNELGSNSVYWYTADVVWPTHANGAWNVWSGSAWEAMTAEQASATCGKSFAILLLLVPTVLFRHSHSCVRRR